MLAQSFIHRWYQLFSTVSILIIAHISSGRPIHTTSDKRKRKVREGRGGRVNYCQFYADVLYRQVCTCVLLTWTLTNIAVSGQLSLLLLTGWERILHNVCSSRPIGCRCMWATVHRYRRNCALRIVGLIFCLFFSAARGQTVEPILTSDTSKCVLLGELHSFWG